MSSEYFSNYANFLEWVKSTCSQRLEVLNNFQTMVHGEWQAMRKNAALGRLDEIEKFLEERSSELQLQATLQDLLEMIGNDPKSILEHLVHLGEFTQHPRTEEQMIISIILLGQKLGVFQEIRSEVLEGMLPPDEAARGYVDRRFVETLKEKINAHIQTLTSKTLPPSEPRIIPYR